MLFNVIYIIIKNWKFITPFHFIIKSADINGDIICPPVNQHGFLIEKQMEGMFHDLGFLSFVTPTSSNLPHFNGERPIVFGSRISRKYLCDGILY